MCRKKNRIQEEPKPQVVEKTLDELTDAEFLASIDELSEPSYLDYLSAPRAGDLRIDKNHYAPETVYFRRIVCVKKEK